MFVLPACSWCCALRILKGVGSDYRRDWCWWCWWWWCPWDCPSPVLHTTRSSLCWPNTRDILPTSSAGETNTDWSTEWCRAAPASGMEECRTSAGAGTTPPSSPLWTTSVRTATTCTRSQTSTPCAGLQSQYGIPWLILTCDRADCFSSGYFQYCLQALLLEEDRFVNMAQVIGRWYFVNVVIL